MQAELNINKVKNVNKFIFMNSYPKEPQANSVDTVIISDDGKMIDNENVVSVVSLENGIKEVITEYNGKDGNDNKPAVIRHTYKIGKEVFIIRKDIQFIGESEWIIRHEYSYNRNKP